MARTSICPEQRDVHRYLPAIACSSAQCTLVTCPPQAVFLTIKTYTTYLVQLLPADTGSCKLFSVLLGSSCSSRGQKRPTEAPCPSQQRGAHIACLQGREGGYLWQEIAEVLTDHSKGFPIQGKVRRGAFKKVVLLLVGNLQNPRSQASGFSCPHDMCWHQCPFCKLPSSDF